MNKKLFVVGSTGFALFSMFFGSGNLVFPLAVGLESEGHYFLASLGILCTCVIFPLLGMYGMMLYQGNVEEFFGCLGKKGAFLFSFLALALMGPFGVLARCLTVIHGALLFILPTASLTTTSLAMCLIIYLLAANKNRIVPLLGTILTPFLLLAMAAIAIFSFLQSSPTTTLEGVGFNAFTNGFFKGYQTMDLVASFFFSGFVIKYLLRTESDKSSSQSLFFKASLVGAALLYFVYLVLVMLGWRYAPLLAQTSPQEMLGKIAVASLGQLAGPMICLLVVLACLTTAIALTSLFAEFLRKDVCREKIGNHPALILTLMSGFLVSSLDFAGIANFLGPILEAIYPALIVLTVINILCKLYGLRSTHWPFTIAIITKLCWV
jgi:LIVCS family branched-chain amino acid:cation transporter